MDVEGIKCVHLEWVLMGTHPSVHALLSNQIDNRKKKREREKRMSRNTLVSK